MTFIPTMADLENFGSQHELVLTLIATCIAFNMPKPGQPFSGITLYTWFYNSVQAFYNSRHPETQISQQKTPDKVETQVTIPEPTAVIASPDKP